MIKFSNSGKVGIVLANGILASVGWYGVYSNGDILSWVVALPFTLFVMLELRGLMKWDGLVESRWL